MKKLQNNFTTLEQSKRLLTLGVPVNSADGYYTDFSDGTHAVYPNYIHYRDIEWWNIGDVTPSWSVGRLIEIYLTCVIEYHPYDDFYTETPSLHLMAFDKDRLIEEVIEIISEDEMDFSKLEEG